ncbi:MAG: DNA primase [Rubrivivax sp.]|nr:DNA primase [Rubrivivax sp.]
MIPAGFIQDLLARTDIGEVVGRHVELKRSGANLMGLCPFHAEKSASFSVSPARQFYHCFGCGASGDAIRFLMEHLGLSFVEAVRELAGRAGLAVPEDRVDEAERTRRQTLRERRLSLRDVLDRAQAFYRAQLRESPRAVAYLKGRGLTGAIAARFGIGYAPPGWRTLAGVFPRYDDPLLAEAGLVRQADDGDAGTAAEPADGRDGRGRYDWFRDRVMFPIRSVSGEVIGFGGRVLDDAKPKYLNSPETPLFSKGRELYGLFEARQAIREAGHALVVEGYMDVVALAQHGLGQAVATLGTACTGDHVGKLFRFTDTVVFAFDGDAAGRRAASRALEASLPHLNDLRTVRFLFLPSEHDPDSFVRAHGRDAFLGAVERAVALSAQIVAQARGDADLATAEGRARFLAQARPLWSALPEGLLKRQLLDVLAGEAGWTGDRLAAAWQTVPAASRERTTRPDSPRRDAPGAARPRPSARAAPAVPADLALAMLLRRSDWWDALPADDHALLHALGGEHAEVVAWLERQITEHGPLSWGALAEALANVPWGASWRRRLEADPAADGYRLDDLHVVLQRLHLDQLKRQAAGLATGATADDETLERLRELHARMAALRAGGGAAGRAQAVEGSHARDFSEPV